MKVVLELQGIDISAIQDIKYQKDSNTITFIYKNRTYLVEIQESLYTYVKVEGEEITLINKEGFLVKNQ